MGGEVVCADEFIGEDRGFMRGNGARGGIGCGSGKIEEIDA